MLPWTVSQGVSVKCYPGRPCHMSARYSTSDGKGTSNLKRKVGPSPKLHRAQVLQRYAAWVRQTLLQCREVASPLEKLLCRVSCPSPVMRGLLAFLGHGYVDGVSGVVWDGAPSDFSSYHLQCAVKDFLIPLTRVRVVPVDFSPQPFDLRLQLNDLRLELDDLQLQSIERSIRRR